MLTAVKFLIKNLSREQYLELMQEFVTEDAIIKSVAEQIVHGLDSDQSCGHDDYYAEPMPPLTAARVYVMKRASQTAALSMDGMITHANSLRAERRKLQAMLNKMTDTLKKQDMTLNQVRVLCENRNDITTCRSILELL